MRIGLRCLSFTVQTAAVPLQAWGGPDGSRNLRFANYVATAQDGGKVVSLMVLNGKAGIPFAIGKTLQKNCNALRKIGLEFYA